jgi:hypothetical protein
MSTRESVLRIFKTKEFARLARRSGITDRSLISSLSRLEAGLIDADLGGSVFKIRLARQGQGKSGGYRVIIAYRSKHRTVFLHGFAKADTGNIDTSELQSLKRAARFALEIDEERVAELLKRRDWSEVSNDA